MKRIIGLGIGGLLALVVGLVLPRLPDSAFHTLSTGATTVTSFPTVGKVTGDVSFQGSAALCVQALHPGWDLMATPATIARYGSMSRSCATASDVMNLGAWLVVIGALALVVAVVVLILGRIRRRPAPRAHAI